MLTYQNFILTLCLTICIPIFCIILLIIYGSYKYTVQASRMLKNKHVVVTGGSSGIGKRLACEAAMRGAHVTIIARNESRLLTAKSEVHKACICSTQRIFTLSLDVTSDYSEVEKAFNDIEQEIGPVYMLINCAGSAICGKLEDILVPDIKKMFELNCLGSIYPTKAVIEKMKSRGDGHVVFVASEAAFIGIYGLSAYSASKFALRGFAEALDMEVRNYGVCVSVAYPPDTDTPGFEEEEKSKPQETSIISQSSGLWKPEDVAARIMKDILAGYFTCTVGFDGLFMNILCAGMSPCSSIIHLVLQILLMGPSRIIAAVYLFYFHRVIKKCMRDRNKSKKVE